MARSLGPCPPTQAEVLILFTNASSPPFCRAWFLLSCTTMFVMMCLFCIVTSLKILASYTLLPLLMYSCKFQLRNSIFIIRYTITCALNDQSCRCAIKQHSFIHWNQIICSYECRFSFYSFSLCSFQLVCKKYFGTPSYCVNLYMNSCTENVCTSFNPVVK